MRRLTEENLKTDVEIGDIMGQLRTQVYPSINEIKRAIDTTNQVFENKLQIERQLLADRFI
jgi:hypothetical protein